MANCASANVKWSREMTNSLISLYELYPCLYKIKQKDYHSKAVREKAIAAITQKLNSMSSLQFDAQFIRKKLHIIRTQYFAERRKVKKSEETGTSSDDVYIPRWWCYESLQFLSQEHTSELQDAEAGEDIFEGKIEDVEDMLVDVDVDPELVKEELMSDTPSTSSSQGFTSSAPRKKRKLTDIIEKVLTTANDHLENLAKKRRDEGVNVGFGQMVVAEMNKIEDEDILDRLKENILRQILDSKKQYRIQMSKKQY